MAGAADVAHGPMFIGLFFNVLLYGAMLVQTNFYFQTSREDKLWMKLFVVALLVADTANSVFDFVYLYKSLIVHYGEATYLARATWVFNTDPALTGIIAALVQFFFAWRVKLLTGNIWLFMIILFASITGLLGGLGTAIACTIIPEFANFRKFEVIVIIWLASECFTDIVITAALSWHLKRHKSGFQGSDELIDKIIRMTIQTGLVTAICATTDLLTFVLMADGTHLIFNFPLAKLYTNSLLSSLNSRRGWTLSSSYSSQPGPVAQVKSSGHKDAHSRPLTDVVQLSPNRPEVYVHVESHEMRDFQSSSDQMSGWDGSDTKMRPKDSDATDLV